jgi:hypothetical protein
VWEQAAKQAAHLHRQLTGEEMDTAISWGDGVLDN